MTNMRYDHDEDGGAFAVSLFNFTLRILVWLIRMVMVMMVKMVMVLLSLLCISLVRMLFDNVGDDCDNVDDHDSDCCGGDDDHP